MYPKMHEAFYFVPPIYFNKTLYKKETVAGEEVYIPQKSSPGDISHDRAMQHVLNCLRQIAEQGQEQMFVLTQFQYRDYLPNLPEDAKCFDFLIVHRKHGVVIGVVKAVSDKKDKTKKDEQTTDKSILTQIAEAVKQLNYADQMIRSISPDLSKKLRRCFGPEGLSDPTEMCLCSEHLADENEMLDDKAVSNIRQIWKWTTSDTDGVDMSRELHLDLVARLCGPSTQSSLQVPEGYEGFKLPKTLADAVSLTGDLYQRSMLDQDMIELLNHRTVFLAGTPNTGKTRMLTLVGRKCLIDGYTIFIIKDSSSKNDAFLSQYLKKQSTEDRIVDEECDFKSQNQRQKCIERIIKEKGDKTCILVDVAHLKGKHVDQFCENLQKKIKPDLFLWVSCNEGTCPPLGVGRRVKKILNCPPAVMREVAKAKVYSTTDVNADDKNEYLLPTDGPPVVYVPHTVSCNCLVHNCEKCGRAVGEFLSENLLNCRKDESRSGTDEFSPLRFEDCLILFEEDFNITKENNFLKGLVTFHINVDVVNKEESIVAANDDSVLAMSVSQMQRCRMKRKIVVYVESYVRVAKDKENKQRALTSCTSQLILVQPTIENNSFFTRIKSFAFQND
ncbi:hypothetical protein C0Q70_17598 [Pomacea canaliculata]|uniref:Uncharacterized protein n=1 Tax=Pomacea canaliculata TaxID=400727 RepID=A0A2T7NKU6_POMCA|nr:hypothetical protein C0Q70_17598 [Pomacea canaliculata]